jgi:cleavage and polyadenylation specificity factor subunit 1
MGAVLQQRINNAWQPLALFSKKLSPTQQKFSAYDRELLAIYEAVKHFRHMLEAPLHHFHQPKGHHLRLPTEAGQMLTATIQPPRFCVPVQNRHKTHLGI